MSKKYPPELAEAAACWIFHPSGFPSRDDQRVLARFGTEEGARLLAVLKPLYDDYNSTVEWPTARNVDEMLMGVHRAFIERHPDIPREIAETFSSSLAYNFR